MSTLTQRGYLLLADIIKAPMPLPTWLRRPAE